MDADTSSDIYVAPLHINKASRDAPALEDEPTASLHTRQMTTINIPQITTTDTDEAQEQEHDQSHPVFQNYLRAIYPFSPSTNLSPSTVTLSLNAGDLVLVHSVHTNGWADGTLLENGARGWLPTNYCEAYEQTPMRPLLKGLTEFWDLIRAGSSSSLNVFRNQDYMRGLIAGVRYLLERSDCLTRDSPLVKSNESLRKTRKALLSDLSLLVKAAKRLQELVLAPESNEVLEEMLDEMLLKAFRIIIRGVLFLEIWTECVALPLARRGSNATLEDEFIGSPASVSIDAFPSSNAMHSARQHKKRSTATSFSSGRSRPSVPSAHESVISTSSQIPPSPSSQPFSMHHKRQSITHRMSYTGESAGLRDLNLASDQLSTCYDTFLGVLASFLGSHLQSRSSSELLLTTQYAVKSCRELLAVVELVLDRRGSPCDMLLEAKDGMYDRITELVHAARDVFRPASSADDDSIFLPEDGKQLLNAATGCVRVAGECVAKTRLVLEQIGDFEINPGAQQSSTRATSVADSPVLPRGEQFLPLAPAEPLNEEPRDQMTTLSPIRPRIRIPSTTLSTPDLVFHSLPSSAAETTSIPPTPAIGQASSDSDNDSPVIATTTHRTSADAAAVAIQLKRHRSLARTVVISTGSDTTYVSSVRDSESSVKSATSTRATSPDTDAAQDNARENNARDPSERQATLVDEIEETEAKLMDMTYAHELMFNKDGQVIGGTLNALIEKLTAHDSTPDALFVSTFYLTFRLFVTPQEFADALSARFEYVAESPRVSGPVRLRVYNVFKGWLESHWRHDCDDIALPHVVGFARNVMTPVLPAAGKRLLELTEQVSMMSGPLVPRVAASMGKTNTSFSSYIPSDSPTPDPIISRSQLLALRTWKMGGGGVSVLDFDPLELARQITLKVSGLFCSILPEELLATEWTKRSGSLAVNVRAMSTLSTDLTNLVADSILQLEEPKKRAATIKQWIKIASKCLELNNFDTLMAIICSLNSTTILRLKKTWDIVSQKTKTLLESLSKVVEFSRNHVVLRQRLQNQKPPCLPFVGMYLTDLTFVDHGNQMTRQLNTETGTLALINFDKHMKTAKIISDLQRFQIAYRFTEVPELQTWMQDQLIRVRSAEEATFQNHYRRSLILEPREQQSSNHPSPIDGGGPKEKERFDFLAWTHITKEKSIASQG